MKLFVIDYVVYGEASIDFILAENEEQAEERYLEDLGERLGNPPDLKSLVEIEVSALEEVIYPDGKYRIQVIKEEQ